MTRTVGAREVRARRSHRKSRKGCTECKIRHIRCDERQPSCANCEIAERTCVFPPPKLGNQKQRKGQGQLNTAKQNRQSISASPSSPDSQVSSRGDAHDVGNADIGTDANNIQRHSAVSPMQLSETHIPSAKCLPGLSNISDGVPKSTFTPEHMILLRYADTVPNFNAPDRNIVDIALRRAVESPYLLDEILAFTAFHMTYMYPGSANHLQDLATELQNRALASFTRLAETVPPDDEVTAVPRFLFSAVLGRHVLADTLTNYRSDFGLFVDRFVECFSLNRGIRAVTPPARDYLYNSEIRPFLDIVLQAQSKILYAGPECEPLNRLMDESDLSATSTKACRQAIEVLQTCFDTCQCLPEDEYPQAASSFSVRIEVGFVDVLRKHQPEALVIIAYYGVLLHRCRSFWAFRDAGAFLIRAISGHLGSYWQEALVWPLQSLETGPSP